MRWQRARRSENVTDGRSGGNGLRVGGGLGLGGIVAVVVISLLMGQDPLQILGQLAGQGTQVSQSQPADGSADAEVDFVSAILGDTEDTWAALFATGGGQYRQPELRLFSGGTNSACGYASSQVGPFYCSLDQKVYLDLGFFRELEQRFKSAGDFAQAYVIAHEVGHHVQNLLGVPATVDAARRNGQPMEGASGLSVRQELQADCYAGVWAFHAQKRLDWMEPGDLEEALNAASAIGDDQLQRRGQGRVVPDSFTHGTSQQRVRWFKAGFESGSPESCDTFAAKAL
ncbi:neutral zinc metallopeptidase [Pseudomonas sp.]|uniref:KPN_02809 family neutral zinc metallopeptidase n=1 Tax=Pseudomonas sp. TaxID=306 RepID=UPI0028A99324|nr:neutral zinc metallopeptidase [Pseudomonas sp.]